MQTLRNLTRDEKPRIERPESKKKQQQEQQQPSSESESDEEDYDYDDLENMASDEVASIVLSSSDEEEEEPMEEDVPSSISDIEDELENMEQTRPSKKRKHVESDDEEMDYELQPRKVGSEWTQKDFVERLPIKLPGGKIVKVDQEDDQEKQEESADEMSQEEEEEQVVEDKAAQVEEEPAPKLTKKQYILAKKEELAQIATQIQEDPDENVGHRMYNGWLNSHHEYDARSIN